MQRSIQVQQSRKLAKTHMKPGGNDIYHGFTNHIEKSFIPGLEQLIKFYQKKLLQYYPLEINEIIEHLFISGYLHDIGITVTVADKNIVPLEADLLHHDHEKRSVEVGKVKFPNHYPLLKKLIESTKVKFNNNTIQQNVKIFSCFIEQIFADADLFSLAFPFKKAFCINSMSLKNEMKNEKTLKEWCAFQAEFCKNHRFHTSGARLLWGPQLKKNASIFQELSKMQTDEMIIEFLKNSYSLENGTDYMYSIPSIHSEEHQPDPIVKP